MHISIYIRVYLFKSQFYIYVQNFLFCFIYLFIYFWRFRKKRKKEKGEKENKLHSGLNKEPNNVVIAAGKQKQNGLPILKERFRSHQKSLALIGCCKIKSDTHG